MKRLVTYSVCALCCCVLFLYSPAAVSWASAGFLIWRDSLLPALLPFFVCASVMQNAGVSGRLERASLIFLSLISGAPAGARLLSGYGEPDARSAAILNNVSPIFIYASFCSGMVGCPRLALYIIPAQFLSATIMLILFPIHIKSRPQASCPSPLRLLSNALQSSVSAMLNICKDLGARARVATPVQPIQQFTQPSKPAMSADDVMASVQQQTAASAAAAAQPVRKPVSPQPKPEPRNSVSESNRGRRKAAEPVDDIDDEDDDDYYDDDEDDDDKKGGFLFGLFKKHKNFDDDDFDDEDDDDFDD